MISTNGLKYQSAVISESMRMYPAGPETTRRIANEGGNVICGQFFPGGVSLPLHVWLAVDFHAGQFSERDLFTDFSWCISLGSRT